MASPDIQKDIALDTVVPSEPKGREPIPLRRTRSMAHSIALNTRANSMPIEQVVSTWAVQARNLQFVDEFLEAPANEDLSEKDKERLRRQAARAIADDWITSLEYTGETRSVDDKIFHHRSLFE